jgi:hypothetical protein
MSIPFLAERVGRAFVTGSVVFFAVWTLVYQVALLAGLPATPSLLGAVMLAGLSLIGLSRLDRDENRGPRHGSAVPSSAASLAVLVVTVLGTALALAGQRALAITLLITTAAVALVLTWRHPPLAAPGGPEDHHPADTSRLEGRSQPSKWLWPVGWLLALLSAALTSVTALPDGDDAYFVNLSTWVAERGHFPLRDTMISPDVFPALSAHSPPIHSVEGLLGTLARVLGIEAGTAAYVLAAPVATALAVLALTYLIQEVDIPYAPVGLTAATGYLWASGASGYSLGSFVLLRSWQGKAMLAAIFLPLVLAFGVRLARRATVKSHVLFGSAVVGAVGASNTGVFLVPVLVGGMVLGLLALRRARHSARLALWLVYPLAAGVVVMLMAPAAPDAAIRQAAGFAEPSPPTLRLDALATVPGSGGGLLAVSSVVLGLGTLGMRGAAARSSVIGVLLTAGLALHPLGRHLLESFGIGSVLWRMWWAIPLPLLVAGTVGAAAARAPAARPVAAVATAVALAAVPLADGRWTWDQAGVRLASPLAWKVPRDALGEAMFVDSISEPGDTALAPWDTSRVLSALTVDVQPVSARRSYLPAYAASPASHAGAREVLQEFADEATPESNTIAAALDLLSVDTACVGRSRGRAVELLEQNGFTRVGSKGTVTCLRR